MFCGKCGFYIPNGNSFCSKCGAPVTMPTSAPSVQPVVLVVTPALQTPPPTQPAEKVPASATIQLSDKWPWLLATIPMSVSIVLSLIIPSNTTIIAIIVVILNIIFASLDDNYLKKKEIQTKSWMWMGIFLVPVYLFVRAAKTNKHFGPGIVWCVLCGLDMVISIAASLS